MFSIFTPDDEDDDDDDDGDDDDYDDDDNDNGDGVDIVEPHCDGDVCHVHHLL